MKTRTQELSVGFFVVVAFVALFFLAMRVSGLTTLFSTQQTYSVVAHFENVGSLSPRAKVTVGGVTVGSVRSVDLDYTRLDAKVVLDIDSRFTKITSDTYASISTSGLLGEQYISLSPGAEEEYLGEGDEITMTQSAMVLEDMVRKYFMSGASDDDEDDSGF